MALTGRERELAVIDGLLGHLDEGGGAMLLRGEAGIGKSALLEEAERRARELGITILKTAGVPSERQMAFAGLHRLLRPYSAGIADLPAPQAAALASAFGAGGASGPDLFLIALAALDLLAEAAADAPLLLAVEDAHWLDPDTCEVLAFVARRVDLEPIALLFALRDGHPSRLDEARLPELSLTTLAGPESARLLDAHAPELTPELRRRVLDVAGGNPLALLELPRALSSGQLAASALTPLPITDALERAFSDRVTELPAATRSVLLVAALGEARSLQEILTAASLYGGRPVSTDELGAAEAAGLVTVTHAGVQFRHPLVRAAVYHEAPTAARHAAHVALAEAHAADPDRSVWHRAAACSGPDASVASQLEAAAARALQRGATTLAAASLERAAQLTPEPSARGALLLRAAEMAFELGRSDLAVKLLDQARPLALREPERARLALLLEAADEDSWSGPGRVASFAAIASQMVDADEPDRAVGALLAVGRSCWWGNPTQETRDVVTGAAHRLGLPEDHPARIAVLACVDPVKHGARINDQIALLPPAATSDPVAMHLVGTAATTVWAFDAAVGFLGHAIDGLRVQGRLGLLAQALVSQAWAALHVARPTLALAAADEAAKLARETGQGRWAVAADLVGATVAGERGDFETLDRLAGQAEAELMPIGAHTMLALVQFARGRGAVAHQLYADGYDQLRRIVDPTDIAYHPFVGSWALSDLIESAANVGRTDEALRRLGELEALEEGTSGPLLCAMLAYSRPLLAADEDAEELYQAALEHGLRGWPCYRTRMLLAYGRWLRRQRRVAESRAPLRAARETADALAFDGLAECARRELRASGESSLHRTPDARDRLTPQELQIAQLAADGLSNREIGQRLYLSHRTVGSHLYRIFPKLGIAARGQIAQALTLPVPPSGGHAVAR